jgi:hypothetical protein
MEAMLSTARLLQDQNSLISQLVSHALVSMTSVSTWETLAANPDEENLRRMTAAWENIDVTSSLPATPRMERCWAVNAFQSGLGNLWSITKSTRAFMPSLSSSPPSPLQNNLHETLLFAMFSLWPTFFRYADERQYLEYMQMVLDSRERNEDWNTLLAKSAAVRAGMESGDISHLIILGTIPSLASNIERVALLDTIAKLTRTAIALRRFALAQGGALPATLEELGPHYLPAVPLDPMDHQPIRYRRTAEGYLLYGIGPNGTDEGGNSAPSARRTSRSMENGLDIVWPQVAP